MYQIGDFVVYGTHGVCRILTIEERRIDRKTAAYYILEPVEQVGTCYMVPVQNEAAVAKMRPVMTREELDDLLRCPEVREDAWIPEENQRKQVYRELIGSGDRKALLRMVCTLFRQRQAQLEAGKKFHLCDENFLRDAERLLSSEMGLILQLPPEQVIAYVRSELQEI